MALSPIEIELHSLIKMRKSQLDLLKNGARVQQVCGAPIDDLMLQGTSARFHLALHFFEAAERLLRMRAPLFRNSISRSYYAMYHAARGIVFVAHRGDDHEEHSVLHNKLPAELQDVDRWKNALKEARLFRNEADYEPYPISDTDFASISRNQLRVSREFIAVARAYLTSKGCTL